MPRLNRWIKVTKSSSCFNPEILKKLTDMGANMACIKNESFNIINVNWKNREAVISMLIENGYIVDVEE